MPVPVRTLLGRVNWTFILTLAGIAAIDLVIAIILWRVSTHHP
jgi:ABC-type uncharacterized transport system permease subunit